MWNIIKTHTPTTSWDPSFWLSMFPLLEHAKSTPQDPTYHAEGDVWTHTKMVVDALLLDSFYQGASLEDRAVMFLSALLHDVSKYETTIVDAQTGRISQPGHGRKGSIVVRRLLWEMDTPLLLREHICNIVTSHQEPFYIFGAHRSTYPPEWHVRRLSHQMPLPLLCAVARADIRGRICPDQNAVLDNIACVEEYAREDNCWDKPRAFINSHAKVAYFRGASVHPDYGLPVHLKSNVLVMCGLPASGKNTWVEKYASDMRVVSFDDMRQELGLRYGQNEGMVAHATIDRAKEFLRRGEHFVWNATHLSQNMRDKTLDLLYSYDAYFDVVYLEQAKTTLLSRNHKRDTSLSNKALLEMANKWQAPTAIESHGLYWNPDYRPIVEMGSLLVEQEFN